MLTRFFSLVFGLGVPGSYAWGLPLSRMLCDRLKVLWKELVLVDPSKCGRVDSVKSALGATSLRAAGLRKRLLNSGLEGEKGEPDRRLDGVPEACCGIGEKPTAKRDVDMGDAL